MNGNIEINGKLIVIGDCHFGIKRFNINTLKNQLKFFDEQIFPYMEKNNIDTIFQLGDIFDNRTNIDIIFMNYIKKYFFEVLVEKNIKLYTLLGNHDIAHRESREVSLISFFENIYSDNLIVFKNRTYITINDNKVYVVPWITNDEDLSYDEIASCHTVLGHFKIQNCMVVKGHKDTNAKLTEKFFRENTTLQNVYSGHFHLKDTKGFIKYLGTPWQINWNDYEEEKGFYVWHEDDYLEFKENKSSKKFVKVKYDDEKNKEKHIEISGLFETSKFYNENEFKSVLPLLDEHEVKVFINHSKDKKYDEMLYKMNKAGLKSAVIDNQEISKIIGTDYIAENKDLDDTRSFILSTVKKEKKDLLPLVIEILAEIDSTQLKDIK